MGSIASVDPWLLELADRGRTYVKTAQRMARIQHTLAVRQGHLLDLSARQAKDRLLRAGATGGLPRMGLRCSRCGAAATIHDWEIAAGMSGDQRSAALKRPQVAKQPGHYHFLRNCPGERRAETIIDVLDAKAEGSI